MRSPVAALSSWWTALRTDRIDRRARRIVRLEFDRQLAGIDEPRPFDVARAAQAATQKLLAEMDVPARRRRVVSTKQRSAWDQWFDQEDFIPDQLVREKGFIVYDEMLENDAEVKNAYSLKKYSLVSPGWEVKPAETGDESKKGQAADLAKFVETVLKGMEHSFDSFLGKLLDAFRQGFKLAEEVYQPIEKGEYAGMWGIRKLLVRNSRWYRFETDEAGELLPNGIIEMPSEHYDPDSYVDSPVPENVSRLPTHKFILFVHGATDDSGESLYGRSDFRAVYRYYWSNLALQKLENAWLERWSDPLRWGEYPATYTDAQESALRGALEELGRIAAATIPEGAQVHVEQAGGAGGHRSPFREAIEQNVSAISRGMLVGDLVQGRGKVGSFALGKMHFTTFLLVVQAIARELAWTLNHQLVRPLIDLNFGDSAGLYPELYFAAANTEDAKVKAEILDLLIKGGVVDKREQWTREFVGIPEMDPDLRAEIEKEREDRKEMFLGGRDGQPATPPPGQQAQPPSGEKPDPKQGERKELAEPVGGHLVFRRTLLPVEQKINYAAVEVGLRDIEARAADEINAAFEKIFSSVHAQIRKRKILEEKKRIEAANIRVDGTNLARALYRTWARSYVQGKVDAITEVNLQLALMGEEPITDERQYIDARDLADRLGIDLTEQQRRLSGSLKISDEELEAFADRQMAIAQTKAAKIAADVQAEIAAQLVTAIENDWDNPKTGRMLDVEVKSRWTAADREFAAGTGPIVTTFENAAYNEGRVTLYNQVGERIEAMVYSAVLDDRTTDFCRRHDGFIALRTDPIWSRIVPPNHFQCRSMIGAVLRGETYDVSEKPAADPSSGFDRIGFNPTAGLARRN